MKARKIRRSFLEFFERHDHRIVPSGSLVPADDPTLLFTNAGMNQFKDVFLGRERRDYRRATTAQKCMRVSGKHNDLDNVGPSLRHHTFFEMLGNFSFGDYFKAEAIELAWTLLTEEWRLEPERLHPTIFEGDATVPRDEEAHGIWARFVPAARITELGADENFWSMGETGPCGRCSEIHYFRGHDRPCAAPVCRGPACDCDRYLEIWNNVFMEFDRQADGRLEPLPAPSIDTGMGLERMAAVLQGVEANYDTDVFTPLLAAIGALAGARYGADSSTDVSMRVIADHARAATFLVGDGVMPSNEWRGYVLRKILRRAMRHGRRLGLTDPFLAALVDVVVAEMGPAYPELQSRHDTIAGIVRAEEERFATVLTAGLGRLEEVLDRAEAGGRGVVPGEEVFRLYDSLGLPVDFIEDLASERRLSVDAEGFQAALERQRERARAGSTFGARADREFSYRSDAVRTALLEADDAFTGYESTVVDEALVLATFDEERRQTEALEEDETGYLVLDRTPFYVEAGGQVSDVGTIAAPEATAAVQDVVRLAPSGPRAHLVHVEAGTLREGDRVRAEVDRGVRDATRRNHTATHLLHAALRRVLGSHVVQAGSLVAPDRLRFDFAHGAALTADERAEIERLVNEQIYRNLPVRTEERSAQEAMAEGAMALFGEKYADRVRVVTIPDVSMELCGGTHCGATGDIGSLVITHEAGVAAGVRRIEAVTGADAVRESQQARSNLAGLVDTLGVASEHAADAVGKLQAEVKRLGRELDRARMQAALGAGTDGGAGDDAKPVGDGFLTTRRVDGLDPSALRELADSLKGRLPGPGVIVLASAVDGKVATVVSVSKSLTRRVHAGDLVKAIAPIVAGGGGGRPDFAQAGGRNPAQITVMLEKAEEIVSELMQRAGATSSDNE